ncbi:ATP-binding cassette domain-containing protein [Nostocoides sp. HKS02]|nr:ATP-binding cassette domain-containing protein [Tetrasphaera sp. HKS02]
MVFPGVAASSLRPGDRARAARTVRALHEVDLRVAEGSVHAVVGPRGAGKTTVLNLLSGYLAPTAGQLLVLGRDVTGQQPEQLARLGVGRSFRPSSVLDALTTAEQVELALASSSADHGRWPPRRELGQFREGAEAVLAEAGLAGQADVLAGSLAPCERRALEFAVAIAPGPQVLLLDEPTAGLGPDDVDRTIALLTRVAAGRTLVLVDHNLYAVRSVADTVTVLRGGEVVAEGAYDEVRPELGA